MPNLRLLQINNVHLTGSFENSFGELRWLCWRHCPLTSLPPSFHPPKLVSLDMQGSNINTLWDGPKHLKNLKILNASHSQYLTTTPDFGGVKMLEKLLLHNCSSLVRVHPSVGVLGNLVRLDLSGCSDLERLPDCIGHMASLVELDLAKCESLRSLPSSICNLSSLEELELYGCFNLERLPVELGNMKSLKRVGASNTAIEQLPDSVGHLSRLFYLGLDECENLRNLPNLSSLKYLEELLLFCCNSLESLPDLPLNLRQLDARFCRSLKELSNVAALKCLSHFSLTNCRNLRNNITIEESYLQGIIYRDYYNMNFPSGVIPNWFSHQRTGSSISFDMPPKLANNFIGMVLWVVVYPVPHVNADIIRAVISNKTEGTEKHSHVEDFYFYYDKEICYMQSFVRYIGKPISMKSQDRIEVRFSGRDVKVERCGVYLLHNNTSTQIGRKRGRDDMDVSETLKL